MSDVSPLTPALSREGRGRTGPNSKGFTLIEVLLAMAILAVVVTVIYQSFSNAGASVKQAEEIRDSTDIARTLLIRITSDISNIYVKESALGETFIAGQKMEDDETKERLDRIDLTTLAKNWASGAANDTTVWEVGYYFQDRPEEKKRVLIRREKRELSKDVPPLEGGVEYELTDQVRGIQIRYSGDGTNWKDEWPKSQSRSQLKAIEIILHMADDRIFETKVDLWGK